MHDEGAWDPEPRIKKDTPDDDSPDSPDSSREHLSK